MLTEKEYEILKLRKKGFTQSEIAKRLNISQPAVSSFEKSIIRKLKDSVETLDIIRSIGLDSPLFKKEGIWLKKIK